jgi:hypothetical protein
MPTSHIAVVAATEDAVQLWATRVAWGGEGIVLKDRRASYRPGQRSPYWLKVKHRYMLPVRVIARDPELVRWGDWGWAVRLSLRYRHPLTGQRVAIMERCGCQSRRRSRFGRATVRRCSAGGSYQTDGCGIRCGSAGLRTERVLSASAAGGVALDRRHEGVLDIATVPRTRRVHRRLPSVRHPRRTAPDVSRHFPSPSIEPRQEVVRTIGRGVHRRPRTVASTRRTT